MGKSRKKIPAWLMEKSTPMHARYGYGEMKADEYIVVSLNDKEQARRIRANVIAHGQYYGKQFVTKIVGSSLHIARVS